MAKATFTNTQKVALQTLRTELVGRRSEQHLGGAVSQQDVVRWAHAQVVDSNVIAFGGNQAITDAVLAVCFPGKAVVGSNHWGWVVG